MSELGGVKSVSLVPWMRAAETVSVMQVLSDGKDEPYALFVGGCVRNLLLGAPVEDIDIATKWTPDEVSEKLKAAGMSVIPTGIDHGTVTAVVGGQSFEITTLRRDVDTDGRRATIAFSDSWVEDAERRDFTINTLLADMDGQIYDPLGDGINDINAKRIVFVGDAAERIAEDGLRMLRYFRFHKLYGAGEPDAEALKACRDAAAQVLNLSKERITQEFFKIMATEHPVDVLQLMFDHSILKEFVFGKDQLIFLKHFCEFQTRYGLVSLPSRLFVLAELKKNHLEFLREYLLFPKVFLKDIESISQILTLPDLSDEQAVKVAVYKYGRVTTAQALMIELVQDRVMNGYAPSALEVIQNWDVPDFPMRGEDLMAQGFKEGPELGEKLRSLEDEWIANGFKAI